MFKFVVIDDEPVIVRDVVSSIESADEDFHVIGTATDGKNGLEIIREKKPDLVFVDICMPVIDGLEMVNILRDEGNQVPVVILSGYQEFDYAKKAIQLEVLDYLVKPMNPFKLKDFLKQLKDKLAANQYEQLRSCIDQVMHFNPLSLQQTTPFEKEQYHLIKICFGAFNFFRNNQFAASNMYLAVQTLKGMCDRIWGRTDYWMIEGKYENELLLVTKNQDGTMHSQKRQLFDEICKIGASNQYVTFVSVAQPKKLTDLREELTALESVLYYQSIFGASSYHVKREQEAIGQQGSPVRIDYEYAHELANKNKKSELLELVKKTFEECEKVQCTQADLNKLLKLLMHSCCPKESVDDMDFMINLVVVNSPNYDILYHKFIEMLIEYANLNQNTGIDDASTKYIVLKVQEYLDQNYKEKILIQEVADRFGFNCSYLCHVFRKQKNVTPNEYIIVKRIERAKELLKGQTDLSVKDIASMVGYEDSYYFSRLFKTYTGVTPTDFRK